MTLRMFRMVLLAALAALLLPSVARADGFRLDLEAGPVWQTRNDFAVPGDTGTLIRVGEDGPDLAGRVTVVWDAGSRWSLRFLAAPLSTSSSFTPDGEVVFDDQIFPAGEKIATDYTFDSYRAGVFYRFAPRGGWSFRAGGTLKVRDAEIALSSAGQRASKANLGVVPLLYGGARLALSDAFALDLDVDAAAAPQGRAIDAALRGELALSGAARAYLGVRVLDGGADNDEVYTFGTFYFTYAGLSWRF
jgi:hypothetical protein